MKRFLLLLHATTLFAQMSPVFPTGRFYAPYIMPRPTPDLPSAFLSQLSAASGIHYFTLAFIIGSSDGSCLATWGGRTSLADETALRAAIDQLRATGGDVLISFGGEAGKELALNCATPEALAAQYQAVIDKYKVAVLDMDIEGTAIKDPASVDRRNAALAAIQAANPGIQVSYTLPVNPTGLAPTGVALLNSAMSHGVKVSVVNLMTMDYGGSADPLQMGPYAISAANGATAQMLDNGIRARLGIIPMIGNNDVKPEVFTLADAKQVADWAQANPVVVRMSMWSVSRDGGCVEGSARGQCSGIPQQAWDFSKILGAFH
ncbi:MAG TPA: chitinase [Bryobacteraceae bacterium]|nr:chitinase [Bryobacteraceae bacterium]